jgi:uncharacterized protein with HEPN domain
MKGINKPEFLKNVLIQDAVIRNIEIIGEASKSISPEFKKSYADIPWKDISGMRDKLIHHYMGVDTEVVWRTAKKDIPLLDKVLKEIV